MLDTYLAAQPPTFSKKFRASWLRVCSEARQSCPGLSLFDASIVSGTTAATPSIRAPSPPLRQPALRVPPPRPDPAAPGASAAESVPSSIIVVGNQAALPDFALLMESELQHQAQQPFPY